MNKLRLKYLFSRHINNECTHEESQELGEYLKDAYFDDDIRLMIENTWDDLKNNDLMDVSDEKADYIFNQITKQRKLKRRNNRVWIRAAAILAVTFSIGLIFYQRYLAKDKNPLRIVKTRSLDILPGGNKARLILGNGRSVILDSAKNGVIALQSGAKINKLQAGQIIYTPSIPGKNDKISDVQWNTIEVPKGGQYNIVLADGTHVFLNSASSLSYPTSFIGNKRQVKLSGEAYFEVAKNAVKPFIVNVNDKQQVEVLGTHFNVEAYNDENTINTTLLEGSVKVITRNKQTIIKPGQSALNNLLESTLNVKTADIDEVMAWRSGFFIFNNENIVSMMKRISRWYDVDVSFRGKMENINFVGNYSRSNSLPNLLKNIEQTEKIHFLIEGRRITAIAK